MTDSRRTILATARATALMPRVKALGANRNVRVAIIGLNNKVDQHIDKLSGGPGRASSRPCNPEISVLDMRAIFGPKWPGRLA